MVEGRALSRPKNMGSARAPRAGDRALAIANFSNSPTLARELQEDFGEGAEIGTRGACAPKVRGSRLPTSTVPGRDLFALDPPEPFQYARP
jgi:hypothetical protein